MGTRLNASILGKNKKTSLFYKTFSIINESCLIQEVKTMIALLFIRTFASDDDGYSDHHNETFPKKVTMDMQLMTS
jgi:hypothetical protein